MLVPLASRTVLVGLAVCLALGLVWAPSDASARRSADRDSSDEYASDEYSSDEDSPKSHARPRSHARSEATPEVERDERGRIRRSPQAKNEFKRQQPCPSTGRSTGACPGYVIDHVVPLKRGGDDTPENMQWQTIEDAKAKDKIE
jgi:hypothetical protein